MLEHVGRPKPRSRARGVIVIGILLAGSALAWGVWAALGHKAETKTSPETPAAVYARSTVDTQAPAKAPAASVPTVDKRPPEPPVEPPAEPLVLIPVGDPSPVKTQNVSRVAATNSAPSTTPAHPTLPGYEERILAAQVALARLGISSGSLDGLLGGQTRAALMAFQQSEGLQANGALDAETRARLGTNGVLYTNYLVTTEDLGRLLPVGPTWLAKSQQARLDYENLLELLAERHLSNPKLLRALNPSLDWNNVSAGTSVRIVAVEILPPSRKAALLRIHTAGRYLQAFDEAGKLLAHFPCSIAARVEKRPVGETLHIVAVAPQPNYTFDPEVFPESAEARQIGRKLILPPGPNNPVGSVWFSLDKPGYGIHGTPRPEDVGRTESHGCFRLANWNAEHLLKLAGPWTAVQVEP